MFVNETQNDLDLNAKASLYLSRKPRIVFAAVSAALMLLGVALILLEYFLPGEEGPDYFLGIFFLVFGVLFLIFTLFFYGKVLRATSKKLMQGKESTVTFSFTEEGYECTSAISDGTSSATRGSLSSFTECREYSDMWLLFLNKATVFALRKDGMKEGTAEELSAFLKSRLGNKYKKCCNKK